MEREEECPLTACRILGCGRPEAAGQEAVSTAAAAEHPTRERRRIAKWPRVNAKSACVQDDREVHGARWGQCERPEDCHEQNA